MSIIGIKFDDDYTTHTTDAVRVWFTTGDKPRNTMSVAVIVRSVSDNSPIQNGVHTKLCAAIRACVEECLRGPSLEVWTTVEMPSPDEPTLPPVDG